MTLRSLAKDSAIYGGADLATRIVAFLAFPLVAEALSPEAFGAVELVVTTVSLLGMFVACGLNNSVQRFYWDPSVPAEARPRVVTSAFAGMVGLAVVAVALGLAAVPFANRLADARGWPIGPIGLVAAVLTAALAPLSQFILDALRLRFEPWRYLLLASVSRVAVLLAGVGAVIVLRQGADEYLGFQAASVRPSMGLNARGLWISFHLRQSRLLALRVNGSLDAGVVLVHC